MARLTTNLISNLITISNVTKTYRLGNVDVHALKGVTLEIQKGDFTALAGSSGSGKTTLLNLIGCLDQPTAGSILIENKNTQTLTEKERTQYRSSHIGFIFQTFNLLPVLSALENVEYPLVLLDVPANERLARAKEALRRVGLEKIVHHRPNQMSGGQRQRVAIARALVKNPQMILADEPTANLDHMTSGEILTLMRELNEKDGVTFIFSTHDQSIISMARKVFWMKDGQEVKKV